MESPLNTKKHFIFFISIILLVLTACSSNAGSSSSTSNTNNSPWYPSLEAFEHYNSGRSHVFPDAQFGGSFYGNNLVNSQRSAPNYLYPSGYNMSYLSADQAFIYGGGYGDESGSIGAFVAKVNPVTLAPIWYNQLIDTSSNREWDYPGSMGILNDGYIYVSYGYRLAKLDPVTGNVINTLILPTEFCNYRLYHDYRLPKYDS